MPGFLYQVVPTRQEGFLEFQPTRQGLPPLPAGELPSATCNNPNMRDIARTSTIETWISFFIFSPLQEFVRNQTLHIFCYGITTNGSVFRYTYFYVYIQSSAIRPIWLILADPDPSSVYAGMIVNESSRCSFMICSVSG